MSAELRLSNDQMPRHHLLLSQDPESNRLELHHMAVLPYRKCVKRRLEPEESLLEAKGIAARKQVMSR